MSRIKSAATTCLVVIAAGVLAPAAAADLAYHSEHLELAAVGDAPLRTGFVENIKAEGPEVYAQEIFVLNGAEGKTTYTVSRTLFPFDPGCGGANGTFTSAVAALSTNTAGNARGSTRVVPEDVAGFEGTHGVAWTVTRDSTGAIDYQTACTAVTLD